MHKLVLKTVGNEFITDAENAIHTKLVKRLGTHGKTANVSRHEILGKLAEEFHELHEAVRAEHISKGKHSVRQELLDIAVGAIYGIASIDCGAIESE